MAAEFLSRFSDRSILTGGIAWHADELRGYSRR